MADPTVLEVYRREVTPELYRDVRELYKKHSLAEDARDLDADAGLRVRARPDRSPLGGPRRRAALLHRAADRLPGHPVQPDRHRDRAAGRVRGGERFGDAAGAVARRASDRGTTRVEGP